MVSSVGLAICWSSRVLAALAWLAALGVAVDLGEFRLPVYLSIHLAGLLLIQLVLPCQSLGTLVATLAIAVPLIAAVALAFYVEKRKRVNPT